jgi:hypothetical protein
MRPLNDRARRPSGAPAAAMRRDKYPCTRPTGPRTGNDNQMGKGGQEMNAKLLLSGMAIALMASSVTFGHGFCVGSCNGAEYFFCGPAQTNVNGGSVGYCENSASVGQYASAYNPCGIAFVCQDAYAVGGRCRGGQGYCAGMSQTVGKCGGCGSVTGIQSGSIQMTQPSCYGGLQSSYATGTQFSMIVGGGSGVSSQSMNVGSLQY